MPARSILPRAVSSRRLTGSERKVSTRQKRGSMRRRARGDEGDNTEYHLRGSRLESQADDMLRGRRGNAFCFAPAAQQPASRTGAYENRCSGDGP